MVDNKYYFMNAYTQHPRIASECYFNVTYAEVRESLDINIVYQSRINKDRIFIWKFYKKDDSYTRILNEL